MELTTEVSWNPRTTASTTNPSSMAHMLTTRTSAFPLGMRGLNGGSAVSPRDVMRYATSRLSSRINSPNVVPPESTNEQAMRSPGKTKGPMPDTPLETRYTDSPGACGTQ